MGYFFTNCCKIEWGQHNFPRIPPLKNWFVNIEMPSSMSLAHTKRRGNSRSPRGRVIDVLVGWPSGSVEVLTEPEAFVMHTPMMITLDSTCTYLGS